MINESHLFFSILFRWYLFQWLVLSQCFDFCKVPFSLKTGLYCIGQTLYLYCNKLLGPYSFPFWGLLNFAVNLIFFLFMQLHAGICRAFHPSVSKLSTIFPFIEASRPRSKPGIQALCSLHVALDKAKGLLQHCADCSRLYLVTFYSPCPTTATY